MHFYYRKETTPKFDKHSLVSRFVRYECYKIYVRVLLRRVQNNDNFSLRLVFNDDFVLKFYLPYIYCVKRLNKNVSYTIK